MIRKPSIGALLRVGVVLIPIFILGLMPSPVVADPTLRDLADQKGIELGVACGYFPMTEFPSGCSDADVLVNEKLLWSAMPQPLRPSRTEFDFRQSDSIIVPFAKAHNQGIQGDHLVWSEGTALPDWLKNGNFSRDELIDILHNHISTVVGHYTGTINRWSVVNEEISDELYSANNPNRGFWLKGIGPEFAEMAFQWAREADPNATLIWNESVDDTRNDVRRGIADTMFARISDLKARGVPIDGIGMHMHIFLGAQDAPTKDGVIATMQRFAALGLKIYVTEFDVDATNLPGTQEQKLAVQAQIYRDMFSACLDSGVCKSFAFFGPTDKYSWYMSPGSNNHPNAQACLYDANFNPKPAYFAIRDVLQAYQPSA